MAANFGNFFSLAIASLLIDYLPMLPFQILLLNLLSDLPMISIATDAITPSELKQTGKFNIKEVALISFIFGMISSCFDFIIFTLFNYPQEPQILQTSWFINSVLTELVLILSLRTKLFFIKAVRPSTFLLGTITIIALITITLPFTYFGQHTLQFIKPTPSMLTIIFGIVIVYFITTEIIKLLFYRMQLNNNNS